MITREQKEWIVEGFCGSFEACGKKCPIRHLCEQVDVNFARFEDDVIDECVKIIAPNIIEDEKPKWISVKEKVPEDSQRVLVCCPGTPSSNAEVLVCSWLSIKKHAAYWMPLPEVQNED